MRRLPYAATPTNPISRSRCLATRVRGHARDAAVNELIIVGDFNSFSLDEHGLHVTISRGAPPDIACSWKGPTSSCEVQCGSENCGGCNQLHVVFEEDGAWIRSYSGDVTVETRNDNGVSAQITGKIKAVLHITTPQPNSTHSTPPQPPHNTQRALTSQHHPQNKHVNNKRRRHHRPRANRTHRTA